MNVFLPKSGCGGRLITTIPPSVPPGFPATPIVCKGGLKSCHWYVLRYSEFNCKDKKGLGSGSWTGVFALALLWLSSSDAAKLNAEGARTGGSRFVWTFSRTADRP